MIDVNKERTQMNNVYQDVWSDYQLAQVKNLIMGPNMPWFVCITDYTSGAIDPNNHKWEHIAYHKDRQESHASTWLQMACGDAIARSGQTVDEIIRIRCSITTITQNNHIADPHVDTDFPHRTALFYLNDCDGDTIMYKEKYDPNSRMDQGTYREQYVPNPTVDYTITPRENQMAWFDGLTYHSSNSPTNSAKRFIINVNYTVRD